MGRANSGVLRTKIDLEIGFDFPHGINRPGLAQTTIVGTVRIVDRKRAVSGIVVGAEVSEYHRLGSGGGMTRDHRSRGKGFRMWVRRILESLTQYFGPGTQFPSLLHRSAGIGMTGNRAFDQQNAGWRFFVDGK